MVTFLMLAIISAGQYQKQWYHDIPTALYEGLTKLLWNCTPSKFLHRQSHWTRQWSTIIIMVSGKYTFILQLSTSFFFLNDVSADKHDLYGLLDVRFILQQRVNKGLFFQVVSRLSPLIMFTACTFWTRAWYNWETYRVIVVLLNLNQLVHNKIKCLQSTVPSVYSQACFCPKCVHECVVFPLCSPHIYNPFYWNPCHLPPAQSSTLKH